MVHIINFLCKKIILFFPLAIEKCKILYLDVVNNEGSSCCLASLKPGIYFILHFTARIFLTNFLNKVFTISHGFDFYYTF